MINEYLQCMIDTGKRASWGGLTWADDGGDASITEAEGQWLYALVRGLKPMFIVEVGTSHGFSTIHLAQACSDNNRGSVTTVETNPYFQEKAKANIEAAGLENLVTFRIDFRNLPDADLVFLDAVHEAEAVREYLSYFSHCHVALVHDANWNDHVKQAIKETEWTLIPLPTDSKEQMALLLR